MQYRILSLQELSTFRTQWCVRRDPHNFYQCSNAHREVNHNILRRNPQLTPYSYEKCMHVTFADAKNGVEYSSTCTAGENCPFAHSREEVMYHVHVYKTKFCQEYMRTRTCPRGDICAFAHGEQEQRYPPVLFSGQGPMPHGEYPQYPDEFPPEAEALLDYNDYYAMERMITRSMGPELTVDSVERESGQSSSVSHTPNPGDTNTRSSSYENSPNYQPVPNVNTMWNLERNTKQPYGDGTALFPQDAVRAMSNRPRPPNVNTSGGKTVVNSKSASRAPNEILSATAPSTVPNRMGNSKSQGADIAVQARQSASAAWPLLASTGGKKVGWNKETEGGSGRLSPQDTDEVLYSDVSGWTVPNNSQSQVIQKDAEIHSLRVALLAMSRNNGLGEIINSHVRALRSLKTVITAAGSQLEVGDLVDACQEFIDCVKKSEKKSTPLRICCLACNEKSPTVIVMPCRHLALCTSCLPQSKQCPQCQAQLNDSVEISI